MIIVIIITTESSYNLEVRMYVPSGMPFVYEFMPNSFAHKFCHRKYVILLFMNVDMTTICFRTADQDASLLD
jgi:hypothetical protein